MADKKDKPVGLPVDHGEEYIEPAGEGTPQEIAKSEKWLKQKQEEEKRKKWEKEASGVAEEADNPLEWINPSSIIKGLGLASLKKAGLSLLSKKATAALAAKKATAAGIVPIALRKKPEAIKNIIKKIEEESWEALETKEADAYNRFLEDRVEKDMAQELEIMIPIWKKEEAKERLRNVLHQVNATVVQDRAYGARNFQPELNQLRAAARDAGIDPGNRDVFELIQYLRRSDL